MVKQKEVAKSFCFYFLSVYILYICYSIIGGYINTTLNNEVVPTVAAMNATTNITMAISNFSGISWLTIVIIVGFIVLLLGMLGAMFGARGMSAAY